MIPCPFCSGEARLVMAGHSYCIECTHVKCLCRTQYLPSEAEASDRWNKRAEGLEIASLPACPCCGGEPVQRVTQDSAQWHYIECKDCGLRHLATKTRSEALQKWQARYV